MSDFVEGLLRRMTVADKIGQMTQVTLHALCADDWESSEPPRFDPDKLHEAIVTCGVGSIFNVAGPAPTTAEWRKVVGRVQQMATGHTRLGIPLVFGVDAVHGSSYTRDGTLFPHNLALAATWDPDLVRAASRITAQETKASGISWNFAPVLDVGRQPMWSRFFETFGEDARLASDMGVAAVQGHADVGGVASCGKHFVGYSGPSTGRDRTTAWLPDGLLRDIYLPPFKAAIDAGVPSLMVNSGDVNGIPVHASRRLLTELLRDELGFDGVIVSDWEDVIKLHTVYRVATSRRDAARIAVEAGIDMSMTPYDLDFARDLMALVEAGEIPESRLDESVRRILSMKEALGLFDRAVPDGALPPSTERDAVSLDAATRSLVLLENSDHVLPLKEGARVSVIGTGADSAAALCGSWSYTWQGADEEAYPPGIQTVREAISTRAGATFCDDPASADVVVMCLSDGPTVEKPGDISDLSFDGEQSATAARWTESGKRVVVVLLFDRPWVLGSWIERADAVIWAGRPGPQGGRGIARILFGDEVPSGKLPFTYPRSTGHVIPYDHRHADRLSSSYGTKRGFEFDAFDPRWAFGSGRSYCDFEYTALSASATADGMTVELTVTNHGDARGRENVLVFISDLFASVAPPVEKLAAYESVELQKGELRAVSIRLPVERMGFHGPHGLVLEDGEYIIRAGSLSVSFSMKHT